MRCFPFAFVPIYFLLTLAVGIALGYAFSLPPASPINCFGRTDTTFGTGSGVSP